MPPRMRPDQDDLSMSHSRGTTRTMPEVVATGSPATVPTSANDTRDTRESL